MARERERASEKGGRAPGGGRGAERARKRETRTRRGRGGSCACLGAKSWASRAQAWPRLTLRSSRSEVILEHEPPSGSQPPSLAESCRRINRIINDRSRPAERLAPRDSTEARNSRRSTLMNSRRVARARESLVRSRTDGRSRPSVSLSNRPTLRPLAADVSSSRSLVDGTLFFLPRSLMFVIMRIGVGRFVVSADTVTRTADGCAARICQTDAHDRR